MKRLICVISLLSATPVFAQVDCTLTGSGIAPAVYTRSAAHQTVGLDVASQVVPLDAAGTPSTTGKIGVAVLGMSNASALAPTVSILFNRGFDDSPAVVWANGPKSGKTTEFWADPTDDAWTHLASRVTSAKLTAAQVQVAIIYVAAQKQLPIPTPAWRFRAIADNLLTNYPNVKLFVWSPINGTNYGTGPYAINIHATIRMDDETLTTLVEDPAAWPAGTWHDLKSLWADGLSPNPSTRSRSFPDGIFWRCSDSDDDGVHQSSNGANRSGWSIFERLIEDPVWRPWALVAP